MKYNKKEQQNWKDKLNWKENKTFLILGGMLISGLVIGGAHDVVHKQSDTQVNEVNAYKQALESINTQYSENSRLNKVIKKANYTASNCIRTIENGGSSFPHIDECKQARKTFLQPIADGKIKVSLSDELPSFSVVQVFKDAVTLHGGVATSTQSLALRKTFEYMAEQKKDGLPYGNGETFTIAEGEVSYYKGSRRAPYILIPSS